MQNPNFQFFDEYKSFDTNFLIFYIRYIGSSSNTCFVKGTCKIFIKKKIGTERSERFDFLSVRLSQLGLYMDVLLTGVMNDKDVKNGERDARETFRRNPYEKLKTFSQNARYRLIDMFKDFDKDQSNTITKEEFARGLEVTHKFNIQPTMNAAYGMQESIFYSIMISSLRLI